MFDWKDFRTGLLLTVATAVGGAIWTLIIKLYENISFIEALKSVYQTKISVVFVALFFLLVFVTNVIIKKSPRKDSHIEGIQQFVKMSDPDSFIMARWKIVFSSGEPHVKDLTLYCTKHDPPLKLINYVCPYKGCVNSNRFAPKAYIQNDVESHVADMWEQLS